MNANEERAALIADLRMNHEYCPKEVILQAADLLAAAAREIELLHRTIESRDSDVRVRNAQVDALQAEIVELEADYADQVLRSMQAEAELAALKQQPTVAWRFKDPKDGLWLYTTHIVDLSKKYWRLKNEQFEPLYLAAGAQQGETK